MKCREMMSRKALLPILEKPFNDECRSHSPNMHCFKGGDSRTNEQPGILSVSCTLTQRTTCRDYCGWADLTDVAMPFGCCWVPCWFLHFYGPTSLCPLV